MIKAPSYLWLGRSYIKVTFKSILNTHFIFFKYSSLPNFIFAGDDVPLFMAEVWRVPHHVPRDTAGVLLLLHQGVPMEDIIRL